MPDDAALVDLGTVDPAEDEARAGALGAALGQARRGAPRRHETGR